MVMHCNQEEVSEEIDCNVIEKMQKNKKKGPMDGIAMEFNGDNKLEEAPTPLKECQTNIHRYIQYNTIQYNTYRARNGEANQLCSSGVSQLTKLF
jgi:hypothetical protein